MVLAMLGVPGAAAADPGTDPAGSVDPAGAFRCRSVTLPVALASGLPDSETISGTLCQPSSFAGGARQVDVLVHGGSFNRSYWDWPTASPRYSYVRRTLHARRATFAYDRLGAGLSSRPVSSAVTLDAEAYVLHRIVTWLRGAQGMTLVNLVGHSFGSMIGVHEAATYGDFDRVVLTGYLHAVGPVSTRDDLQYPAALDPKFADGGYDSGYLTTRPGVRASMFFSAEADPAVLADDETLKDVLSVQLLTDGLAALFAPAGSNDANAVRVPVLIVDGALDQVYCGLDLDCADPAAVRAREVPYFTSAARLDVATIPGTGHALPLHPSADISFGIINQWLACGR